MSSKQKTPKKPKATKEVEKPKAAEKQPLPASTLLKNAGRAAALLVIAGIASPVSQLNLSPVYGSIPASLHHKWATTFTVIAALVNRRALRRYISTRNAVYIAVIAFWTPVIQCLLFPHSSTLSIEYGPLVIESLTYFPLLFLSVYAAGGLLDSIDPSRFNLPPALGELAIPAASYFTVSSVAKLAGATLPGVIGSRVYLTRIGLQTLIASASALLTPSLTILLAVPALLHTLTLNPHSPSSYALQRANATLSATQNYTVLARQESITGYVSVLENSADNAFRLLRCDHSLLGGEWLVTPSAYSKGQRQQETIFAVFVLLEAVRLVEPPTSMPVIPDNKKKALNIGLGIGTAPNAMIGHGINTTIVELDPAVHEYATEYFNLSPNHNAVLSDAVAFVAETSVSHPASYDYIIHDVFTGGAEPAALFTTEFMQGLSDLLTLDGVVAINYAGDLTLGSTKLVLNTIHAVFPACRLFRDSPPNEGAKPGDPDFINMVIFCVKMPRNMPTRGPHGTKKIGTPPITFRRAVREDFLGSIARQNFLQPRPELEVKYSYESGDQVMGRGDVGELEKFHEQGAVSHWRIMRTVLPSGVWEMW
ncbi:hypothetical protein P153DRAFT_371166 [Dothidotthia symphoricarpi CBS 119687]|uniref:S-adenosyl-L-methionine-dependent methyltransferase n=1 Tax=Dothidotthia symphoricarpi CBS 119687 TaxID=1392245 RepID=A0A6A5ZZJ1_9PLEO|nr:uncharacterized protein P153DRAFT_371166 [Dothidotthia symphoricarpi CBS 119687]KAF2124314.1 hypothetical protein P153DRAFT_371166 [Dothidotthia symphoricarpi CBS 119687]